MIWLLDLNKKFKDKVIFSNANLFINTNSFVMITGESGSGKSTLLNIIGLLDKPESGDYTVFGNKVNWNDLEQQSKIRNKYLGFIFQSFNLLPGYTARENILMPLMYTENVNYDEVEVRLLDIAKKIKIELLLEKNISLLSGGEKQRVAIARALITNPQVLLCDEATGNLDDETADDVLEILYDEHKAGKTIIFVTHNKEIAKKGTRHIIVKDGGIYESE